MKRIQWTALALLSLSLSLSLSLAGCGGGHDSVTLNMPQTAPGAFDEVPASAKATAAGYTAFAAGLRKSETALPLDISQTTPPTSETEAPQPI
jgi:hypothetical protein